MGVKIDKEPDVPGWAIFAGIFWGVVWLALVFWVPYVIWTR